MTRSDRARAFVGHRLHLVRSREVPRLVKLLGPDLAGRRVLDVAGGDGYWAGRLQRRGATAVSLDIALDKLRFGQRLADAPSLLDADALALPFPGECFDAVVSVCALEHFADHRRALSEMARVLHPGGRLALSVDALTGAARYPRLFRRHSERYHVVRTFDRESLRADLEACGLDVVDTTYLMRGPGEGLYLLASRLRPAWSWNALAVLAPVTALVDRLRPDRGGALLIAAARKPAPAAPPAPAR